MASDTRDGYSVLFARYATKLEQHLIKCGISCHDADIIIEESSVIYFENINSKDSSKFFSLIRKHNPAQLFAESATRAIERHLPESKDTFGSYSEIAKCIK